jgi:hypothetical protein
MAMSDDEIVAGMTGYQVPEQEMLRRLIVATRELRDAMDEFRHASESSAKILNRLTFALIALTVILVFRDVLT